MEKLTSSVLKVFEGKNVNVLVNKEYKIRVLFCGRKRRRKNGTSETVTTHIVRKLQTSQIIQD